MLNSALPTGNVIINLILYFMSQFMFKQDLAMAYFPDRSKDKIGYEIPFTRYFYKYTPPRKSSEILKEIIANEEELQQTLKEVLK